MQIEQLSIFLENKTGRLVEVAKVLFEANINIHALSIADTSDFGILRLVVSDPVLAKKCLKDNGFIVDQNHVVAILVPNQPGGLYNILTLFKDTDINVDYMYAYIQENNQAVMIFRFNDAEEALKILKINNIETLKTKEVYS